VRQYGLPPHMAGVQRQPRCKFIGLRFVSCFFLSKKKASTEGANISVWGLTYVYIEVGALILHGQGETPWTPH